MAARRADVREGYRRGEEIWRARALEQYQGHFNVVDAVKQMFLDKAHPALKLQRMAEDKARGDMADAVNAKYALGELAYGDDRSSMWLKKLQREVHEPMLAAGISPTDMGEYLQMKRIAGGDRTEIANPAGHTPETAKEMLADLERQLGPAKWAALDGQYAPAFHAMVYAETERAVRAGSYNAETHAKVIEPNRGNYATFAVLDYLQDNIPAGIRQQVGTFKDVANPYTASIMKTLSLRRLNDLQDAKNTLRDMLLEHLPGEIEKQPSRVLGMKSNGTPVFGEPRPPEGKEHLVVLEDGKPAYYAVDPYVARVFKSPANNALIRAIRALSAPFRPLMVAWNPAWALGNVPRDFARAYRNLVRVPGQPGLAKFMAEWFKALPDAMSRVRGIDNATVDEMIRSSALAQRGRVYQEDPDAQKLDRLLQNHGLLPRADANRLLGLLKKTTDAIEAFGAATIAVPKIASWRLARQAGMTPRQAAYFVRNLGGHPDFRRGGHLTPLSNNVLLFSNMAGQALCADYDTATNPKTRSGWWMRYLLTSGIPRLLMKAASMGIMGYGLKKMMDAIPEYDKVNYICIPYGWSNGKVLYLRIPQDEAGRLISGTLWKSSQFFEKNWSDALGGLFQFWSSQAPSMSPWLESADKWGQFLSGQNPYDAFYRQDTVTPTDFTAGGWYAYRDMLTWQLNQFGVASIIAHPAIQTLGAGNASKQGPTSMLIDSIPGINRFFRESDSGVREDQEQGERMEDEERARFRLSLPDEARDLVRERYQLDRLFRSGPMSVADQQRRSQVDSFYSQAYLPLTKGILAAQKDGDRVLETRLRGQLAAVAKSLGQPIKP